jgi:hypothetical protein
MSKPLTSTELIRLTAARRKAYVAVEVLTVARDRAQYAYDEAGQAFAEAESEYHRASQECNDAWHIHYENALKSGEVE